MILIYYFLFYFSLKSFLINMKHILLMLMSLEFMGLIMLVVIISLINKYNTDYHFSMYFVVILVCESVLGVSMLTLFIRSLGSDYLKCSSLILC
uniref:NADH-ubiquinone oxidoreductase chain 4L n=1 Tax=Pseudophacopteron sp. DMP-2018 TaxID=2908812 RepID=A0A344A2P3_9HEMI|nr:NADH dehydrogenase subunit 4L [Pseudophacopteron sp. DMP-2018]